jgi:hypothetical protein
MNKVRSSAWLTVVASQDFLVQVPYRTPVAGQEFVEVTLPGRGFHSGVHVELSARHRR